MILGVSLWRGELIHWGDGGGGGGPDNGFATTSTALFGSSVRAADAASTDRTD